MMLIFLWTLRRRCASSMTTKSQATALMSLALALVIRFIPVMLTRTEAISLAFRARSPRRPGWRLLMPVSLAALDDAEHVADALRARGGVG